MSWKVVESIEVDEYWPNANLYVAISVSGQTVKASVFDYNSSRTREVYVITSSIPNGTSVRASYSGYIFNVPKSVTTEALTVGTNGTKSARLGETYDSYAFIEGTLYLEKYGTPPPTPSSISVPTTIKGGESITISWGSSSGATRYHLERSVNGGTWTQIYSGSSRSYTDTITKGWKTVAYRVRAYNSDGYSGYRTSPTITVINFPEMQIKINGVLKTSDAGWVRVNGQLREIDTIWVKINGAIKEVQ